MSRRPLSRLLPVLLIAALAVLAATPATAQTGATRTYVTSDCSDAAFKPRSIVLTCGDAGLVASKLQWKQWGASKARGSGRGEEKVCTPNCAEGTVAKGKMALTLSKPRLCPQDGKRHFTKVHYSWPEGAPGEGPQQGTIPLPCAIL